MYTYIFVYISEVNVRIVALHLNCKKLEKFDRDVTKCFINYSVMTKVNSHTWTVVGLQQYYVYF